MTPQEIQQELHALVKGIGPRASGYINVWHDRPTEPVNVSLYPNGMTREPYLSIRAKTFEEAFTSIRALIADYMKTHGETVAKTMALAIIQTYFETDTCTYSQLRGRGFSQEEIDEHLQDALHAANRMSMRAPFVVENDGGINVNDVYEDVEL